MQKLIIWCVVGAIGIFTFKGYQQYSKNQLMLIAQEQEGIDYRQEKKALDLARSSNDPEAIRAFIQQYPGSVWLDIAYYQHDRLVVQDAINAKDTSKLNRFIHQNRHSQWRQHAEHYLKKFNRVRDEEQEKKTSQLSQQNAEQTIGGIPRPVQNKVTHTTKIKKSSNNDSRDRVNRALSIYQKMSNQKQLKVRQQKKQQLNEEKQVHHCNTMKDQLKQYSRRIRWYELDNQGNRIFLNKEEVNRRKQTTQNNYNKYCQ